MLAKGLRSHSLYNSVLYILSSTKSACMLCGLLLWMFSLCNGIVEINVIYKFNT
jgi:hypothetical protein